MLNRPEKTVSMPPHEKRVCKASAKSTAGATQEVVQARPRPCRNVPEVAYTANDGPILVVRRRPIIQPHVPRLPGQEGKFLAYSGILFPC
jgi:hypothetical protein